MYSWPGVLARNSLTSVQQFTNWQEQREGWVTQKHARIYLSISLWLWVDVNGCQVIWPFPLVGRWNYTWDVNNLLLRTILHGVQRRCVTRTLATCYGKRKHIAQLVHHRDWTELNYMYLGKQAGLSVCLHKAVVLVQPIRPFSPMIISYWCPFRTLSSSESLTFICSSLYRCRGNGSWSRVLRRGWDKNQ